MFVRGNNFFENNTFFIFIFVPITIFDPMKGKRKFDRNKTRSTNVFVHEKFSNKLHWKHDRVIPVKLLFDIKIVRKARILLLLYSITVQHLLVDISLSWK